MKVETDDDRNALGRSRQRKWLRPWRVNHVLLNMDFIGLWSAGGGSNGSGQGIGKILVMPVVMLILIYFDKKMVEIISNVK